MTEKRILKRDKRTGLEFIRDWVDGFDSQSDAARSVPMKPAHLRIWMWDADRNFGSEVARKLARAIGVPLEVVLFKHERICDVLKS